MKSFRLLVVAPTYWPIMDDVSFRLIHWTAALRQRGIHVSVLTPRWNSLWPATAECREVPIFRLLPPPKTNWSQAHFLRAVGRWIVAHRQQFDAVYIDQPNSILHQLGNSRHQHLLPMIARYQVADLSLSDFGISSIEPLTAAENCRKAQVIVTPDSSSDRRLRSFGITGPQLRRIGDADWYSIRRDPANREASAKAFKNISSDLVVSRGHRLIVSLGAVSRRSGLAQFAKCLGRLLDDGAKLQAWVIGSGDQMRPLYEKLKDDSWHRDILLQGNFDSIDDVLQLADLCVFPGEGWSLGAYFPATVGSGVPWICAKSDEASAMVGADFDELFFAPGDWGGLANRLQSWYREPEPFEKASQLARKSFIRAVDSEAILYAWMQLFDDIRSG